MRQNTQCIEFNKTGKTRNVPVSEGMRSLLDAADAAAASVPWDRAARDGEDQGVCMGKQIDGYGGNSDQTG